MTQPITSLQELANLLGIDLRLPVAAPSASKLGFFGASPVERPSAYTQSYSSASKTVSTPPTLAGTDYASESAQIQTSLNQLTTNINALIDDLQALGLIQ